MPRFAVIQVRGPAWDPARSMREQDGWDAHAAFMDGLEAEGFIVLGGPLGDGERVLLVIDAASEADVRARLAQDPWSPGLRQVGSVEHWEILLASVS
jgi:uncharacterized protein YciI